MHYVIILVRGGDDICPWRRKKRKWGWNTSLCLFASFTLVPPSFDFHLIFSWTCSFFFFPIPIAVILSIFFWLVFFDFPLSSSDNNKQNMTLRSWTDIFPALLLLLFIFSRNLKKGSLPFPADDDCLTTKNMMLSIALVSIMQPRVIRKSLMDRREERDFFWLWGLSSEWSSFDFLHFPVDPLSLSFLSHSFSIQFLNILSSYISPCTNKTLSSWLPVFSYCFPGTSFYSCNAVINSVVSLYCHSPCLVVQLTPLPPP